MEQSLFRASNIGNVITKAYLFVAATSIVVFVVSLAFLVYHANRIGTFTYMANRIMAVEGSLDEVNLRLARCAGLIGEAEQSTETASDFAKRLIPVCAPIPVRMGETVVVHDPDGVTARLMGAMASAASE